MNKENNLGSLDTNKTLKNNLVKKIIFRDVLNFFNLFAVIVTVFLIIVEAYAGLFVIAIAFIKTIISIYFDYRSYRYRKQNVDNIMISSEQSVIHEVTINSKLTKEGDSIISPYENKNLDAIERDESYVRGVFRKFFMGSSILAIAVFVIGFIFTMTNANAFSYEGFKTYGKPLSSVLVLFIPFTLALVFTLITLINIKRFKHVDIITPHSMVNEAFASSKAICFEKNFLLSDNKLVLKEIIPVKDVELSHLKSVIYRVVNSVGGNDQYSMALMSAVSGFGEAEARATISFNKMNNYIAASYSDGTYFIGAPHQMNLTSKHQLLRYVEEYSLKGYHVLVVAKGGSTIVNNAYHGVVEPLGILLLGENVKDEAKEILKELVLDGTIIYVVSSENALLASKAARNVGIGHGDKFISVKNMDDEHLMSIAHQYVVFGDATEHQKLVIVSALKQKHGKVSYLGCEKDDVSAMLRSDMGITLGTAAPEAKNASDAVLNSNHLNSLLVLRLESKNCLNAFERMFTLFITKTFFTFLITIFFLVSSIIIDRSELTFPLSTNQLLIAELLVYPVFGILFFFGNYVIKPNDHFLKNTFRIAIPASLLMGIGVIVIFSFYLFGVLNKVYTSINQIEIASSASAFFVTVFSLILSFKCMMPMKHQRVRLFILGMLPSTIALLVLFFTGYMGHNGDNIFGINFEIMSGANYFLVLMLLFGLGALMMISIYVYEMISGKYINEAEEKKDEN